jgi:Domain of unknown function (DUF4440)
MRGWVLFSSIVGLTCTALAQAPTQAKPGDSPPSSTTSSDSSLKDMFDSKIKAEWEALKNKDKKAYGDLLADDYEGVEVDGGGERTKLQALSELAGTNVFNYSLWGLKVIPAGSDAALVIYESTMQFPPKSAIRYSRVYISELWLKRAGQWKEVHYQETHVK